MPAVTRAPGPSYAEVADRVWVARHEYLDVNTAVVGGERGVVVVDTLWSIAAGRRLVHDVRSLGAGPLVAVVNTHEHFDHVLGNGALGGAWPGVPVHAHEEAAARTAAAVDRVKELYRADPDDPRREEVLATAAAPADHAFSSAAAVDLGDRLVELVHPGRGHTGGDAVVLVPDARVALVGDLVEESGPPAYGGDCFPLEWPGTLDLVLQLVPTDWAVVPGHGAVVDRRFVERQRDDVGQVAETIRDLAGRGVPAAGALAAADWPYPSDRLADAVRRGYAQLPPGTRSLPMA